MRPRITLPLAGLALLLSAATASAQPEGSAGEYYSQGLKFFSAQKFKEAATALEKSYDAKADQKTLFAWAQAERLSGHCDKARELFAKYMASGANEKQTRAAYKLMEDCQPATDNGSETSTTDGTDSTTDTTSISGTATGDTNSDGETNTGNVSSATQLGLAEEGPTENAQVDGSKPWYKDWIAVSLFSVGAVSLGVSGFSYASALALEDEGMEPGTTYQDFLDLKSQSEGDRNLAMIFGAGGVLCVGAGIAYVMLRNPDDGKESTSAEQSFTVQVDGNSAGFAFGGHF